MAARVIQARSVTPAGVHTTHACSCFRVVDSSRASLPFSHAQELRRRGVAFVVAPFEADAQMAFLASTGAVAAVITEDSDLVAYGVARVFLKLDLKTGCGVEVAAAALPRCRELNLSGFSADTFLHMCVLSGCDYAPGLPGVGPRKAAGLLRRFRTVAAAVRHLRFEGTPVPRGYEAQLQDALWTFAHQFVYDAGARACVHRTPLPHVGGPPPERVGALLGAAPPPEEAAGIAEGRLDPMTLLPFPVRCCHGASRTPRPAESASHVRANVRLRVSAALTCPPPRIRRRRCLRQHRTRREHGPRRWRLLPLRRKRHSHES
jgi:exonuclease-1